MARSVTVQNVIDGARHRATDASGRLATTAQCITFVDRAHARLYSYYAQAEPDRYRTEATITVSVAGTASYAVPAAWFSTIAVDYAVGNDRDPLLRLQEDERNDYVGQTGRSQAYRVIGTNVVLYPTPNVGETYTHVYLPTAPVLTLVGDTIDCRIGHEEYLELLVARRLLQSEQSYGGEFEAEIAKVETELKLEANLRYLQSVSTMRPARKTRPWPLSTARWPWSRHR